ncbi:MAG: EAL domain-containing protein [Bacilli bacterium]|nr:EAL domain-containing protein [Bacilli bacterium]
MNDNILEAFLSQQNTIILFWDTDDIWHTVKNNDSLIKTEYCTNDGIFDLFSLVSEQDKNSFTRFVNTIRNKKLSRESNPIKNTIDAIFMLQFVDNIEMYYKFSCYETNNNEMLIKIERLSIEDSYRYNIAQLATNDKMGIGFNIEATKLLKRYPDRNFALIQFDIENFKVINRQHGEVFGDVLLKFIINSLKYICNEEQLYVRLSADVFMILTAYETQSDIISFIDKIRSNISNYDNVNYRLVFGINFITDHSINLRKYSDGAAIARQSIKKDALKYYAFYSEDMVSNVEDEVWITMNMESALLHKEFQMYLQPKYSISTNQIVGAEALVRWINPDKGLILPIKFIPLFEANGFIKKLDQFIWEEACKCLRDWRNNNLPIIPISVNVSRKNLTDLEYIDLLESLLEKYQIDKCYLELEITETLEEPEVQHKLTILKQRGFTLLMDDFGSGYSSLNTLKDAVFDVVKIDREFLNNFISSIKGQRIVEHTINMTRDIGMDIVAEGVETLDQANFLHSCGCDIVQGYLYAKPMSLEDFNNLRLISLNKE